MTAAHPVASSRADFTRVPAPILAAYAGGILGLLFAVLPAPAREVALLAPIVAAAAIDLRTRRIPNWLTAGAGAFALAATVGGVFAAAALGGVAALAAGLGLTLLAGGGFGMGDAKLMGVAGAGLGLAGVPGLLFAMSLAGGVLALVAVASSPRGQRARRTFAYGPAIAAGYAVTLLVLG